MLRDRPFLQGVGRQIRPADADYVGDLPGADGQDISGGSREDGVFGRRERMAAGRQVVLYPVIVGKKTIQLEDAA